MDERLFINLCGTDDRSACLGRAFFDTLSPGRSAAYGFFLGADHWWNFWPGVIAQSLIAIWTRCLSRLLPAMTFRATGSPL